MIGYPLQTLTQTLHVLQTGHHQHLILLGESPLP